MDEIFPKQDNVLKVSPSQLSTTMVVDEDQAASDVVKNKDIKVINNSFYIWVCK